MDKFQEMASLVSVVESGSFVAAAQSGGLSKAAVSRHIADLEQRLGVRLLQRTTRRLSLTADGQAFYSRCKELLTAVDEAESEVGPRNGEPAGLLRISAPLSFGVLHLAPLWGRFTERYPKVTLDIALSDRVVDIVEEGYDLAIRIAALASSTLVSRRLARTRMVMCASPRYLERHGAPTHPDQLAAHRVIAYSNWATRDVWNLQGPQGPVSVRTAPCLHTNNGDTCRLAALDHQGIILQPTFLIADDLRSGRLVELLPEYRSETFGIHAVYSSRKHLPLKTRRLVDFLVDAFREPAWEH